MSDIGVGNYWETSHRASGKISDAEAVACVGLLPDMLSDPRLDPGASRLVREIFRRMNLLGLTPTSLAAKTGRNATYFRDLFQGRSAAPSTKFLPAIAEALECEVADLLNPREPGSEPTAHGDTDKLDEIALIGFWRSLSEDGKRRVLRSIIREANRARKGEPEGTDS